MIVSKHRNIYCALDSGIICWFNCCSLGCNTLEAFWTTWREGPEMVCIERPAECSSPQSRAVSSFATPGSQFSSLARKCSFCPWKSSKAYNKDTWNRGIFSASACFAVMLSGNTWSYNSLLQVLTQRRSCASRKLRLTKTIEETRTPK